MKYVVPFAVSEEGVVYADVRVSLEDAVPIDFVTVALAL